MYFSFFSSLFFHKLSQYFLALLSLPSIESLIRYRLLSEPELSNLLKTTLSNGSLQSSKCQQKSEDDTESTISKLELPENSLSDQEFSLIADTNDNNSQNRNNNNNLVQTWSCRIVIYYKGWIFITWSSLMKENKNTYIPFQFFFVTLPTNKKNHQKGL